MMDDDLPIVGPEVDLSQAPAINHKRTLAFLNHFITHTVRFLNKFSCVCEEKLSSLQVRIQRLEVTLSILEAKLSSIPGLDQVAPVDTTTTAAEAVTTTEVTTTGPGETSPSNNTPIEHDDTPPKEAEPEIPTLTVSKDPRYMKFFKMVNFGVPPQAVKVKMAAEGLNPDLLDNPNASVPDGGASASQPTETSDLEDSSDNDSSDEASSFSDSD